MKSSLPILMLLLLALSSVAQQQSPLQSLQRMADLPADQVSVSDAALLLDAAVHPEVSVLKYARILDGMAEKLRPQLESDATTEMKLQRMAALIYDEWHFADSSALPADVYVGLHEVLDQQQWNCFGMTVLYVALGERLGLPLRMVSGRGHVFVQFAGEPSLYVETTKQGEVHATKDYLKEYLPFPCLNLNEYRVLDQKQAVSVLVSQTALALQSRQQVQPALNCFQVALEFDPKNAEAHAGIGFIQLAKKNIMAAGEAFKQALEADAKFREAYGGLGTMLHQAGHDAAAVQAYRKAVELCPEEPAAVFNLAQLLYEAGQLPESVEQFQRYVKLAPADPEGFVGLALALEDQGKLDEARAAYEEALKLRPDHLDANINLGYVLERQQLDAAAEPYYRAALKAAPKNALAWAGVGRIATRRGAYEEAAAAIDAALQADPENASLHLDRGNLLRAMGKDDEALETFQKARSMDPEDTEARDAVVDLLRRLGRNAEADALLQPPQK